MAITKGGILTPYDKCIVKPPTGRGAGIAVNNGLNKIAGGQKGSAGKVDEVTLIDVAGGPSYGDGSLDKGISKNIATPMRTRK